MGLALEEPGDEDQSIDADGITLSIPPDVAHILRYYGNATLDHDARWRGTGFFVRFEGRRVSCS